MKIIKLGVLTFLMAATSACYSNAPKSYSNYDDAAKDATATINEAKAANYEWRDSRKMLKKAEKLNKEGKSEAAIKLAIKAQKQGALAIAQAKQQSGVTGPHQ